MRPRNFRRRQFLCGLVANLQPLVDRSLRGRAATPDGKQAAPAEGAVPAADPPVRQVGQAELPCEVSRPGGDALGRRTTFTWTGPLAGTVGGYGADLRANRTTFVYDCLGPRINKDASGS